MVDLTYYLFNLAIIGPVAWLCWRFDIKLHRDYKALGAVFLAVSMPFIVWDSWAASEGHWLFSERFITSLRVFSLPIEEILFFITVPFAMLYVWRAILKHYRPARALSPAIPTAIIAAIGLTSLLLGLVYWDRGYTRSVMLASALTSILLIVSKLHVLRQFWLFQAFHLALFALSNSFLTALPVISYGKDSIIGQRVGTIPLEDFFFSYALINLILIIYNKFSLQVRGRAPLGVIVAQR